MVSYDRWVGVSEQKRVEEELLPHVRFHPRVSVYREVLREAYRKIIESGVEPYVQLYPVLLHILKVFVFRRPWLRREFSKLLFRILTEDLDLDEGAARDAVERFVKTGEIDHIVDAVEARMREEEIKKMKMLDPGDVRKKAEEIVRKRIVQAAEYFLIDIGII